MATLEKLALCGLRSFGPYEDDMQQVKFASPLTLFLGENGCGKTTIIEALKFACSGEVPGGSKSGQGFVHDPKLAGKAIIKGQVRLKISDAKGNKYLIIKSVQLTNRGATSSFKRLDTALKKINPDGSETSISSRCADIDTNICEILGVSKAILNNVIFCHQENAAWPLEEGKKLKEKFDEIFGATEYNKCAENIRKMIKENETNNKILISRVAMLKQTADIVNQQRSSLQAKEEKLEGYEGEIREKENALEPIIKRLQEISDLETNLAQLQTSRAEKETRKATAIEQQNSILKNITTEYSGSNEELRSEIASFEVNRGKIKDNLKKLEGKKEQIETEHKQLSGSIDRTQIKLGKLQQQKKQHESTVAERNKFVETAANGFKVQVPSEFNSNDDVKIAINTIKKASEDSKNSLKNLAEVCDSEEALLQESVDDCRDKLAKTNHDIESKNKQIRDNKSKHRDIQSQLRELDYSDEQLKSFESKISRIDADLQHLKSSFDVNVVTESITSDKQKMNQQEEKLEVLERERKVLAQNRVTEAEIETQRHDVIKRESDIHKLKNKHFESFNKIFGDDIPNPGFIKRGVDTHKQTNTNKTNELNKKINIKQKETTTLETKCRFQKKHLETLQEELQKCETKVFELCKGKPFDTECTELHQTIEKLQRKKGQYSSAKIMYEKFLEDFQKEKPCCPICLTGFANQQAAVTEIVQKIRSKIQGIPQELQKTEEDLKLKQQRYSKLLQSKPDNDRIEELNSLIPKAISDDADLETTYKSISTELNELTQQLVEPQNILDACNKVISDAALIDQYQLEINRSQSKIMELESQLSQVPSQRSLQQTEVEIENVKMDISNARRNYETSQRKLQQHNERCQELREQRSKHVEKQLQLQKNMQGKPQLQDQLTELNQKEGILQTEIEELKLKLNPLKTELADAEKTKEMLKSTNRKKQNDAQDEYNKNLQMLSEIIKLQKKVDSYFQEGIDGLYETSVADLNKYKEKETNLEANKKEITKNIAEIDKQLTSQVMFLRNLEDNLQLRDIRKEEQKLSAEIEDYKRQIGNHNYRTVLQEKHAKQGEESKLKREKDILLGKCDQLKQEIQDLKKDLNTPANKQAYTNYKKAFIQHTVAKEGINNLRLYLNALEIAVLTFHKERMNQINKIIRYLWRSIYKGNDCDYIEIKTDETKNTGNRRTYNYKVVQFKSGVEIEMRGRCSAGQRVLACLVIRIALAETFSKNCGILALDEPTTNLDRANITSLSEALSKIVNARQAEKNFQLLIITHDEEFVTALSHVDKVSYFWRVSRNENGNSVVSREAI